MKIKFKYLAALLTITLVSCKKNFLDVKDNRGINRQTYVKDISALNEFLNGAYFKLAEAIEHASAPCAYPEVISDNLKPVSQLLSIQYEWIQKPDKLDIQERAGIDPESTSMNGFWMSGYRIIRSCNFVIENADKYHKENPVLCDDLKGQAFAMRALIHLKLVNIYAQAYTFSTDGSHQGIPYINTYDISKPYTRQMVAEVYNLMIEDLMKAIDLIPEHGNDPRTINRLAAIGLLSRIYLFKGDYESARRLALEVTGKVDLMTVSEGYPDNVFKFRYMENTETLFQITPVNAFTLGRSLASGAALRPTSDIVAVLNENPDDVRSKWVSGSGIDWKTTKFPQNAAPEVIPIITPTNGAYYNCVIRSSEMFLIVAECSAKLGDENIARDYLNRIRKRANPAAENVIASGSELLDLIYKERRKELCFEGLRMADLQRWKLGVHRIDAPVPSAKDLPFGSDKAIAPIPQQDVELMGIPQNKGY